jgi:hypothetical protein
VVRRVQESRPQHGLPAVAVGEPTGTGELTRTRESPGRVHAGAGGRDVVHPAAVLARAAQALAGYVEERNGARGEDTRCWFQLRDAEGTEVRDAWPAGPSSSSTATRSGPG